MSPIDRSAAVETFRARLQTLIERGRESRAAFAGRAGMDRSTLSQLLSTDNDRLPRAETVMAIAAAGQVSCDWLLGLAQDEQQGTELLTPGMEIEAGAASPVDERLARWHREAAGYKIRYIPTTLPDLLKTEEVIRYECPELADSTPETSLEQAAFRLSYSRDPDTEMEVCCAWQSIAEFASGQGVWAELGADARRRQIERMARLTEELYPTIRWYLYDGLRHFSAPVTLFGPKRAAVYVGNLYFVFNTTEHIRVLAGHFDALVRVATVQPADMPSYLEDLLKKVR